MLASRNFAQLRATFDEYVKVHIQFINCIQAVQPIENNNHLGLNLTGRCLEAATRNVSIRVKVSCIVATKIPSRLGEVSVRDGWPCAARDSSALIAYVELSGTLMFNWPVRYINHSLKSGALKVWSSRLYRESRVK